MTGPQPPPGARALARRVAGAGRRRAGRLLAGSDPAVAGRLRAEAQDVELPTWEEFARRVGDLLARAVAGGG